MKIKGYFYSPYLFYLIYNDMAKIKFSGRVFKQVNREKIRKDIIQSMQSSPEFKKEIARIFQIANRRIQNIEARGEVSPAVMALNKGEIKGFTKFSMRGSWEDLKLEYGKAVSFLRQPTSTATGTREYGQHIQKAYDLSPQDYKLMQNQLLQRVNSLDDTEYVERYLFRYKDFTGELQTEARSASDQIETDAQKLSDAIQEQIENTADQIAGTLDEIENSIINTLNNFKL